VEILSRECLLRLMASVLVLEEIKTSPNMPTAEIPLKVPGRIRDDCATTISNVQISEHVDHQDTVQIAC